MAYMLANRRGDLIAYARRQFNRSGARVLRMKGKAGGPDLQVGAATVHLRGWDTSDLNVFFQIFSSKEYAGLCDHLEMYFGKDASVFFVDGGANVGLATAYCGGRMPGLVSVGIEPFIENHRLAGWNARYDQLLLGALGTDSGAHVRLQHAGTPQGQWGIRTQVDPAGEIPIVTLEEIISGYSHRSFDVRVLKLDIEGAEFDVIHGTAGDVLQWFDLIVVEMHGTPEENRGLVRRLHALGFTGLPMGEYWIFMAIPSRSAVNFGA